MQKQCGVPQDVILTSTRTSLCPTPTNRTTGKPIKELVYDLGNYIMCSSFFEILRVCKCSLY